MTFLDLVQKMRRDIGIQGTGPATVVSQTGNFERLVDFIADADEEIQCLYEDWDFLRTTVAFNTSAATSVYTQVVVASADAVGKWDVESFCINPNTTNFAPLTELDFHLWKNSGVRLAAEPGGTPTQFVIDQNESIILIPTPDAVYLMQAEHWAAPIRLVDNTDVSIIPKRFHQTIIELATLKYAKFDENDVLAAEAKYQYEEVWRPRLEAAELRGSKKAFASFDPDFIVVPV